MGSRAAWLRAGVGSRPRGEPPPRMRLWGWASWVQKGNLCRAAPFAAGQLGPEVPAARLSLQLLTPGLCPALGGLAPPWEQPAGRPLVATRRAWPWTCFHVRPGRWGGVNCPRCWPWALTVAPEGLEAAHGHMLGTCGRWGRWGSRGRSAAGPLARPPGPPGGRHQPAMACVGSVLGLPGGPGGHARGSSRMAAEGLRTVGASPVQRAHGASEGGACPCGRPCSREHRAWGSSSLPWGAGAVRSPMATEEVPLCQRQHLWQLRAEQEAGCLGVAGGRSGSDRPLRVWSYVMWPDRVSSSGRLTSGQRC